MSATLVKCRPSAAKEAEYDFLIDHRKVEVGGRKKGRKDADFVVRDDVDLPTGQVLPLWMLGLEYSAGQRKVAPSAC